MPPTVIPKKVPHIDALQLVLYPVLNLRNHQQMDLHWYLRTLEEVIIRALEEVSGIEAGRIEGLTGVWVDDQKVAAIGIRAKRCVDVVPISSR